MTHDDDDDDNNNDETRAQAQLSSKRLLFITATEVTVYCWRAGVLTQASVLPGGKAGIAAFTELLAKRPQIPNLILVDLAEEEFRLESTPHVLLNRTQLLRRKAARLFRAEALSRWQILGREKLGRRDDHVLFSAITNQEILKPWLEVLSRHKAPLLAIHSVPYLIGKLVKPWQEELKDVLLVTDLKGGGLRQTFFHKGQLASSRLTLTKDHDTPEGYADYLLDQIGKSRHYLQRLQLLPFGQSDLAVWVIGSEERLRAISEHPNLEPNLHLRGFYLSEIASRLKLALDGAYGLADAVTTDYQLNLLLAQLAESQRGGGYAGTRERRYALHRTLKRAIGLTAAASLGLLSILAAGHLGQALNAQEQKRLLADQLQHFTLLRSEQVGEQDLRVRADKMSSAVLSAAWLGQVPATPEPFLRDLGPILLRFPDFQLEQISWRLETAQAADAPAELNETTLPGAAGFRQIVEIKGQQILPAADLRQALLRQEQLEQVLGREMPKVVRVELISQQPLDFRPTIALRGAAFDLPHSVPFDLQLTLRVASPGLPQGIPPGNESSAAAEDLSEVAQ